MGVKINIPLIMLVAAQVAILVFGIVELKNPNRNWAFYNRRIRTDAITTHTIGGCTFKPHPGTPHKIPTTHTQIAPDAPSTETPLLPNWTDPSPDSESSDSTSSLNSESTAIQTIEASAEERNLTDGEPLTIAYSRNHQRYNFPRHQWVELGWKNWCSPILCGRLVYGAGAVAKDAALYGAITCIVGSIIMILATFFVSLNDNKKLMSGTMLVSMVVIFLLFLLTATTTSWIVWVVYVHKYIHHLDASYTVTYGYCFVLAILASCMEFFSLLLLFLSRWKFGMELPIGKDPEEEAHYSKLHSQRIANLL